MIQQTASRQRCRRDVAEVMKLFALDAEDLSSEGCGTEPGGVPGCDVTVAKQMKKRSERRKHCARAGCSKVRTPPARPPVANTHTHRQDR